MDKTPEALPDIVKSEIAEDKEFKEDASEAKKETTRTVWIVVLAFALLASLGVIVWLVLSGRPDQKIHGDNLENFTNLPSESSRLEPEEGTVVTDSEINLNDYNSNITLTNSGEYTLTGLLDYSLVVKSADPVTLNLDGVVIPSVSDFPIFARDTEVTLNFVSGKTTVLTGKSGDFNPSDFSYSGQPSLAVALSSTIKISSTVFLHNLDSGDSLSFDAMGSFQNLIYSSADLVPGDYEILVNNVVLGTATAN